MTDLIAQLVVPILALVVLAALLATASGRGRSIYGMALGTAGVVVGGPLAMLMLGSLAARADEPTAKSDAADKPTVENKSDQASSSSGGSSSPSSESSDSHNELDIHEATIKYPDDYPEWAEADPIRSGDIHKNFVTSGPYAKRLECMQKLNESLLASTNEYIEEYLGAPGAGKYFQYDLVFIKNYLLDPDPDFTYSGKILSDLGPMRIEHRVLRFDTSFRQQLDRRWTQISKELAEQKERRKAQSRLLLTLLGAGGVFGLLATIFTYFKLDNATRGFYTGRLQFASLAAILAIVAAGVMVARWIPWM